MQELVQRVNAALKKPWNAKNGRKKSVGLYKAVKISCLYIRHNSTQELLGDLHNISQPTISRIVTTIVPIIEEVLQEFVPSVADAIELVKGEACLVDGTITPCWSYRNHHELWSWKHGITGFNTQVISLLDGEPIYISDPLPGKTHDTAAYHQTPVAEIIRNSGGGIADKGYQGTEMATPRKKPYGGEFSQNDNEENAQISILRAPIERVIAHLKSWRILHTDYRRPYNTYASTFNATRGLFFFSITWGFE